MATRNAKNTLSALNENGKPVDWWFAYKVPKLGKKANKLAATGYEYIYYDAKIKKVVQSPNLLTDGKGAIDFTLKSIFEKPAPSTGWILYNDEVPVDANEKDSSKYGHTKGVIAFDVESETAFWLLHSWPKYADPDLKHDPTPLYGQTFLCLSLDMATASKIADQMTNHQVPQVYTPRIPKGLDKKDPLYLLTQTLDPNVAGDSSVLDFKTRGGLDFKVMAKNRNWDKDFWIDLVGHTLKTNLKVETWIRGKIPPMLDDDGKHKTFDVKYIDLSPLGVDWSWPETKDHAKWGISVDTDWICVGDINRMVSQEKRGGGTIAFQDEKLWTALSKIDLVVPPTGKSKDDAMEMIKSTHKN